MTGSLAFPAVTRREKFAWSMYDFANSGYTTVVLTTIFNAYFVAVVAGGAGLDSGTATFVWTLAVAGGNAIVLISAPIIGAIADTQAWKKRFLLITSLGCIATTVLLGLVGEGALVAGIVLLVISLVMFGSGEYLIAAFLPELAPEKELGRLSGYGWGLGYCGGLLTLACSLGYISWAQAQGHSAAAYVPVTLWITAAIFAIAALPTFVLLRERSIPSRDPLIRSYVAQGLLRVAQTLRHARHYQDLFRFLVTLVVFQAGMSTVIVVAAIYAQETLGFSSTDLIFLIMLVNVTAAAGALSMGHLQDRIGSARSLALALSIWILALILVLLADERADIWLPANLMGLGMGSTQSAARALIGQFTPRARSGEFFGLWGLATHLAMIIGPITYGALSWMTDGDQRIALLSTLAFFIAGLAMLTTVDEARGRRAALAGNNS